MELRNQKISEEAWGHILKPYKIRAELLKKNVEKIEIGPLPKGYGVIIGNSLRRILLSSIQGSAVSQVKIEGVSSEFSPIAGVEEDAADVLLNLKSLDVSLHNVEAQRFVIRKSERGPVLASDIQQDPLLSILNPNQCICHLDGSQELFMEILIQKGVAYEPLIVSPECPSFLEGKEGRNIAVDAYYSPIKRVAVKIEKIRVGAQTDFEKVALEIETNGAISPRQSLTLAAKILQEQFGKLVDYDFLEETKTEEDVSSQVKEGLPRTLYMKIEDLNLNVRSNNCLQSASVIYVGDLVQKKESDLLASPNFGKKSLQEIKDRLGELGLSLDMNIPNWNPEKEEDEEV